MRKTLSLSAVLAFAAGLASAQTIDKDLAEYQAQAGARAKARAEAQKLPWEQINAKFGPDWPTMAYDGIPVSIFALCRADADTFVLRGPKKTMNICRDTGYDQRDVYTCKEERVTIPVVATSEECPDPQRNEYRDCPNPVKVSSTRPMTYQVDVYERDIHEDRVAMFTKSYTIPACQ